jgi:hypothetical protein
MYDTVSETLFPNQGTGDLTRQGAVAGGYVPLDYPFFLAHPSGSGGLWLKWAKPNACVVAETGQYDSMQVLTSAEDAKNRRYFKQGDCGQGFFSFIELVDALGGNKLVDDESNLLGYFP